MTKLVYVDMDGVIADFNRGIHAIHNKPDIYDLPKSRGIWHPETLWGDMTREEMWAPVHADSHNFWAELHKTKEADAIIQMLEGVFGSIAILTTPSSDPGCVSGKLEWIKKNFPQYENKVIFAESKYLISGKDRILVDDKDSNIREWETAGGEGILVPRPWNSGFTLRNSSLRQISGRLFGKFYES